MVRVFNLGLMMFFTHIQMIFSSVFLHVSIGFPNCLNVLPLVFLEIQQLI